MDRNFKQGMDSERRSRERSDVDLREETHRAISTIRERLGSFEDVMLLEALARDELSQSGKLTGRQRRGSDACPDQRSPTAGARRVKRVRRREGGEEPGQS